MLNRENFALDGLNYLLSIHSLDNITIPPLPQVVKVARLMSHTILEDQLMVQPLIKTGPLMLSKKDSHILDTCTPAISEFIEMVELASTHF